MKSLASVTPLNIPGSDAITPQPKVSPTNHQANQQGSGITKGASDLFQSMMEHHRSVSRFEGQARAGRTFEPQELLAMQLRVGELQVQVELVAKVSDTATGLVRRLHQGG